MNNRYSLNRRDKKLAGVCSTIGDIFNVDPTFIRIGFVAVALFIEWEIALVAYITMSLHQRLRNQTLVQQSLFVFLMLSVNEVVVWGIEGWSGHSVASPWRWIQPMVGAMLWPFIALLVGRTHTRT